MFDDALFSSIFLEFFFFIIINVLNVRQSILNNKVFTINQETYVVYFILYFYVANQQRFDLK